MLLKGPFMLLAEFENLEWFACRIRKTFMNGAHVAMIGEQVDLTYPTEYLGDSPDVLGALLKGGKDKDSLLNRLKGAQRPAVIVGPGVLGRPDRDAVLQQVRVNFCKGVCRL